jgi:hypothetical protein
MVLDLMILVLEVSLLNIFLKMLGDFAASVAELSPPETKSI